MSAHDYNGGLMSVAMSDPHFLVSVQCSRDEPKRRSLKAKNFSSFVISKRNIKVLLRQKIKAKKCLGNIISWYQDLV